MTLNVNILDAVILDMDGLLIDSERASFECWKAACNEFGYVMDIDVFAKAVGVSLEQSHVLFRQDLGQEFPAEKIRERKEEIYSAQLKVAGLKIKNGANKFLLYLDEQEIPWCIVTSTHREKAIERLIASKLYREDLLLICADMYSKPKTEPDLFLLAASRLNAIPQNCIVIEDTEIGMTGALRAGMKTILVPDLRKPSEEAKSKALFVASDLHEVIHFLNELYGLP